jgi:hypothetical protein
MGHIFHLGPRQQPSKSKQATKAPAITKQLARLACAAAAHPVSQQR